MIEREIGSVPVMGCGVGGGGWNSKIATMIELASDMDYLTTKNAPTLACQERFAGRERLEGALERGAQRGHHEKDQADAQRDPADDHDDRTQSIEHPGGILHQAVQIQGKVLGCHSDSPPFCTSCLQGALL